MNKEYKSVLFTNHAMDRLSLRSITADMVHRAVTDPEKTIPIGGGKKKFIRTVNDRKLHVVGQLLKPENKWLIISVWVRGEDDKAPLIWRIITLPFVLVWKILKFLVKSLLSARK